MTEKTENNQPEIKGLVINGQYIKDFSFENPNAPQIMVDMKNSPQISVEMNVEGRQLAERAYEVVLKTHIDAKTQAGDQAFLLELEYAAVASVGDDIPEEARQGVILVDVPRLLFPFVRRIIAEITQDAGYPPLFINPVDFVSLLRRKQQEDLARKDSEGNA